MIAIEGTCNAYNQALKRNKRECLWAGQHYEGTDWETEHGTKVKHDKQERTCGQGPTFGSLVYQTMRDSRSQPMRMHASL